MYDTHFGLSDRPFQLTPDPRFWFETATHRKAMTYLGYGLAQGEGFIVITGDIGAGKTTLIGHLVDTIDHQRLHVVKLVSTAIEADDLLRIVATNLNVDPAGLVKAQLLTAIERGLHAVARSGKRTLLIVDEAQALPVSALEELRMLSNFQAGGHALLQIVLLGQPEFRDRLHGSDRLEQLRQRIIAIHHLDAMEEDEVADYLAHRLGVVGWQGNPDFADDAFAAFYRGSGGVPRRLNLLAGRVMLQAAVEELTLIDAGVVEAVIADMAADMPVQTANLPSSVRAGPFDFAQESPVEAPVYTPREHEGLRQAQPERGGGEVALEPATSDRIAALEARIEQQDEALRRVLTLLVDWVESDSARPVRAPATVEPVPIRGAATWDHAA